MTKAFGKASFRLPGRTKRRPGSSTGLVAPKLNIDNWRWADASLYPNRKRMAKRITEISIQFQKAPFHAFRKHFGGQFAANRLVSINRIGIARFRSLLPGPVMTAPLKWTGPTSIYWKCLRIEPLLYDYMIMTPPFQIADMVEAGYVITPVLDVWKAASRTFPNYAAGSGSRESMNFKRWQGGEESMTLRTNLEQNGMHKPSVVFFDGITHY
jgi:glucose-6-phosphate 1-dehydrogenase